MLGWLRVQGYQILNSSNNYWFPSKLPPSKSHPEPGRQAAGDKAYEWRMEVANTQFSSDSQPWHQTQLVKVTESLPASHPDVGLPGCLIRQPVLQRGSPWDVYLGLPRPSVVSMCSWSLNMSYTCACLQPRYPAGVYTYSHTHAVNKHPPKDSLSKPMWKWAQ